MKTHCSVKSPLHTDFSLLKSPLHKDFQYSHNSKIGYYEVDGNCSYCFFIIASNYKGMEGDESINYVTKVSNNCSQLASQSGYHRFWPLSSILIIKPNPNNGF